MAFSDKDREAYRLYKVGGYSQVQAYLKTHSESTEQNALDNAFRYFKRITKQFDSLSKTEKMRVLCVDEVSVLENTAKLMNANKIIFVNNQEKTVPDNATRFQATKLAADINGMVGTNRKEEETENNDDKLTLILVDEQLKVKE